MENKISILFVVDLPLVDMQRMLEEHGLEISVPEYVTSGFEAKAEEIDVKYNAWPLYDFLTNRWQSKILFHGLKEGFIKAPWPMTKVPFLSHPTGPTRLMAEVCTNISSEEVLLIAQENTYGQLGHISLELYVEGLDLQGKLNPNNPDHNRLYALGTGSNLKKAE